MFHRRLLLLGALLAFGLVALAWQLSRWTLTHGGELKEKAESYLVSRQWLPIGRGRILDRDGVVLAEDRPSFNVSVDYNVITGEWAFSQSYWRARRLNRERWATLTRVERRDLAEQYMPDFEGRLNRMWNELARLGGISRDELDERRDAVKKRVQAITGAYRKNLLSKKETEAGPSGLDSSGLRDELDRPVAEELMPHILLRDIDDQTAFTIIRSTQDAAAEADDIGRTGVSGGVEPTPVLPGVSVSYAGTRDYPNSSRIVTLDRSTFPGPLRSDAPVQVEVEGVATHIVGWMRGRIFAEDNMLATGEPMPRTLEDGSPNGAYYLETESIGSAGMERAAERELRGVRGVRTTKLDTREQFERAPVPGGDVRLTIDTQLQATIQALLSPMTGLAVVQPWHSSRQDDEELPRGVPTIGERLAGAVVVIEVDTGEVLAMVSSPTFTREELKETPDAVFHDRVMTPAVNRAISQPYAPGSIVKPLVLCGAVTDGKYNITERIACTGHYLPNEPNILRCWTEKQFGTNHSVLFQHDVDGSDAIMGSCNIFFYEMGKRLGLMGISGWYEKFGVGPHAARWELGLGYEYEGALPDGAKSGPSDAYLLGIGQGQIAWTPMHAADAYATLARAGIKIRPRLLKDSPTITSDLRLNPAGVEQALTGLRRAATEDQNSTAHHITIPTLRGPVREVIFNVLQEPGLHVWAKSGTADASAIVAKDENGRNRVMRDGDHAWCVLLCGDESSGSPRPKYAVAVVADYGGSGGRVSGPIANQVVRALLNAGYLKRSARVEIAVPGDSRP